MIFIVAVEKKNDSELYRYFKKLNCYRKDILETMPVFKRIEEILESTTSAHDNNFKEYKDFFNYIEYFIINEKNRDNTNDIIEDYLNKFYNAIKKTEYTIEKYFYNYKSYDNIKNAKIVHKINKIFKGAKLKSQNFIEIIYFGTSKNNKYYLEDIKNFFTIIEYFVNNLTEETSQEISLNINISLKDFYNIIAEKNENNCSFEDFIGQLKHKIITEYFDNNKKIHDKYTILLEKINTNNNIKNNKEKIFKNFIENIITQITPQNKNKINVIMENSIDDLNNLIDNIDSSHINQQFQMKIIDLSSINICKNQSIKIISKELKNKIITEYFNNNKAIYNKYNTLSKKININNIEFYENYKIFNNLIEDIIEEIIPQNTNEINVIIENSIDDLNNLIENITTKDFIEYITELDKKYKEIVSNKTQKFNK